MRASLLLGGLSWMWPTRAASQAPGQGTGQGIGRGMDALGQGTTQLMDLAAGALVRVIETSREKAIATGVRAIPAGVQRALGGFFPAALLQRVRYRVITAQDGLSLPQLAFDHGHADAITLGDVILFRRDHAAQTDLVLWAHELTHVMQYQRWGTEGFAARYVRDYQAVEKEARDNAARFKAWQGRR